MNDVEMFFGCWRIEVRCDFVKVGFRCPFRAWRKPSLFTPLLQLALAQIVRCNDQMKLVLGVGPFKQLTEPRALLSCINGKVEDD